MNLPTTGDSETPLDPSALSNDAHYLRAVTQMADSQVVVAESAIYSEGGIKLLDKGVRIDSRLYERLIQHRLAGEVDDQLTTSDAVDVHCIAAQVQRLSDSSLLGQQLVQWLGDKHPRLVQVVQHMKWPQRASFKMTVMRHQLPQLFEHSILMMMVAVSLAVQEDMSQEDCAELAAAALLHDIGMLYMPPGWENVQHKLTLSERKQLAVHSITAMLVVQSTKSYSRRAEDAVLEHHERLDGSGYPGHTRGDAISLWGRILMLAEVVSAFYGKFSDMPAQRLSLVLRMNHSRFDHRLTQHVHALLSQEQSVDSAQQMAPAHSTAQVRQVVAMLAAVMQHWAACKRKFPEKWQTLASGRAGVYVDLRMQALEKSLAESGSHPRQQADWLKMFEEDPSSMAELVLINKEALWQVESSVETCMRRWPQLLQPSDALAEALNDWLVNCRSVFGKEGASAPAAKVAETTGNLSEN